MDNKLKELKRLAEKCPVQRFEPFIGRAGGRGTQAIFNADTKSEAITWSGFDSSDVGSRAGRESLARFIAAADPETVIVLLAELERERKQRISWENLAKLNITEREKDINSLLSVRQHNKELEAKLATPVPLPAVLMGYQSDDFRDGFILGVESSGDAVRSVGFKCEGDK